MVCLLMDAEASGSVVGRDGDRNGGARVRSVAVVSGDVHGTVEGFPGRGQRCNSRRAVAGAGVVRTVKIETDGLLVV